MAEQLGLTSSYGKEVLLNTYLRSAGLRVLKKVLLFPTLPYSIPRE